MALKGMISISRRGVETEEVVDLFPLLLVSAEDGVNGSQSTVHLRCGRTHGILVGVCAAVAAVLALAHSGHVARRASPHYETILVESGIKPSSQLHDAEGRCLAPREHEDRIRLVLTECNDENEDQFFTVDAKVGRIQQKRESGNLWCVEQASSTTEDGTALFLEKCWPGFHLQRLVGFCFQGNMSESETWAFAKSCDPSATPPMLGVSLFCWMAVLPGSGEIALMDNAKYYNESIYACDSSKVYWSKRTKMLENEVGEKFTGNAGVFFEIWQQIFDDELYKSHDWTVKVDPDMVWMPQVLRDRLGGLETHINERAYVLNTNKAFGFLGPIEILSQVAVAHLSEHAVASCPPYDWDGEDGWLKECMDGLNVSAKEDRGLLNSNPHIWECSNPSYAAFHYFKTPYEWDQCLENIQKSHSM